jgi:hypothetical protein
MRQERHPVFDVLDEAGFQYTVRYDADGVPYAQFAWATSGTAPISVTAAFYDGAFDLRVHHLDLGERACTRGLADLTADLRWARLYRAMPEDEVELAVALYVDGARLRSFRFIELLAHLAAARDFAIGSTSSPPRLPALAPGALAGDGTRRALEQLAAMPTDEPSLDPPHEIELPDLDRRALVTTERLTHEWIRVSGQVTAPGPLVLADGQDELFEQLQRWAPSGRFLLSQRREVSIEIHAHRLERPWPQLVTWCSGELVRMLGTAVIHAEQR